MAEPLIVQFNGLLSERHDEGFNSDAGFGDFLGSGMHGNGLSYSSMYARSYRSAQVWYGTFLNDGPNPGMQALLSPQRSPQSLVEVSLQHSTTPHQASESR